MLAVLLLLVGDPRLVVTPDAEVGLGYDDNLFLNPDLVSAAGGAVGDYILHVAPRIPAAFLFGDGHSLTLTYDLVWHEPLSGSYGTIADQLTTLEYRTPEIATGLAPLVLRAQAIGERYDATFTSNGTISNYDAFWLGGGEVGGLLVGRIGRGGLAYRYQVRDYSNRDQQDREHRVFASYEARPVPHLSAAASYTFTYVGSTATFLDGADRHRFGLPLRADLFSGDFSVRVEPSLTVQTLPNFSMPTPMCMGMPISQMCPPSVRHDKIFGLTAAATLRLTDSLDALFRADLLRATSDDEIPPQGNQPGTPGTGSFSRTQIIFGVLGRFSAATAPAPVASTPETGADRPLAPRKQPGGVIRFRLKVPGARQVQVLGEWNQWQPEPMTQVAEGEDLWQVDLTLPTGRYAYSFSVDEQPVRPPDADAYVSDGFGGVNGVIEVAP